MLEAVDNFFVRAAFEVCTSDTHAEEGVATETNLFGLTVIADTTRCVTRGVQDGQHVAAKSDQVGVGKILADGRHFHREVDTQYFTGLLTHLRHQKLIVYVYLRFQTVGIVDDTIAHTMVEMAVGTEQVLGRETRRMDITGDGSTFFFVEGATVDDDALFRFVADHIAILCQHVTGEALDCDHIGK